MAFKFDNDRHLNELALFAGAGGGILGGKLLGWRTVCGVEIEPYCRENLMRRQEEKILEPFPIWDDVKTFDGKPWHGKVDIVSGGFPCQDISIAGSGKGIEGTRSGLWIEMARIISEVRPRYAWVENSPELVRRGLGMVLGDLTEMGYATVWGIVGADNAGANHKRKRIWILAHSMCSNGSTEQRKQQKNGTKRIVGSSKIGKIEMAYSNKQHDDGRGFDSSTVQRKRSEKTEIQESKMANTIRSECKSGTRRWGIRKSDSKISSGRWWILDPAELPDSDCKGRRERTVIKGEISKKTRGTKSDIGNPSQSRTDWPVESRLGRVAHGVAHRVDRLKAIGNGQVPAVVELAWKILNVMKDDMDN